MYCSEGIALAHEMRIVFALHVISFFSTAGAMLNFMARMEPIGRPLLERYCANSGFTPSITFEADEESEQLQLRVWRWISACTSDLVLSQPRVLALPALEPPQLNALVEMAEPHLALTTLPPDAPIGGLLQIEPPAQTVAAEVLPIDRPATVGRMQAWVARTLTPEGLRFCPYTGSESVSGTGLEGSGITPAPIAYHVATGTSIPQLLETFWEACIAMLEGGEEGCSSIILAAPGFDEQWETWCRVVFPCLEASLLASGRGRDLGIVCFHPEYVTPSEEWLARHRFGHMHSTSRLRGYVEQHDQQLSEATDDESLAWAGAYQRRSPHAMINVLWSRQLEVAETKRKSSSLYTRNIERALSAGRGALEQAAAAERQRGREAARRAE